MKTFRPFLLLLLGITSQLSMAATADPLPSWNNTSAKQQIIKFVQQSTQQNADTFIPVEDRIATFDNDGTLWAEKPVYFQFYFVLDQIKAKASQHPEWKTEEPYASVLKGDLEGVKKSGMDGVMKLAMATHAGMSADQFEATVAEWLKTAKHPTTQRPYTQMVYQPMIELLHYLQANDFKTYIVSGGGVEFMRVWAPAVYNIPKEQILGSSVKTEYSLIDGKPTIMRLPELSVNNDKAQKPLTIQTYIGKKPVIAVGNSDGDLEMLQWTKSSTYPSLALLLHHTDAEREWAYDKDSAIGHLEKALPLAKQDNWTVIDMKNDWKHVFAQ